MIDNMGGIEKIQVLSAEHIHSFAETKEYVLLIASDRYITIPATPESITFEHTQNTSESGTITHEINLQANVPMPLIKPQIANLNGKKIIVILETTNGQKYVIGTQRYPLVATITNLLATTPNDYNGIKITASGTTTTPPMLLF